MPGGPIIQSRSGANQFDGTAGAGLFRFDEWDDMPLGGRIVLTNVAYRCEDTGSGDVSVWLTPRGADIDQGIILFDELEADIANVIAGADISTCGRVLPRDRSTGQHWDVVLVTANKTDDAVAIVDYILRNYSDDLEV